MIDAVFHPIWDVMMSCLTSLNGITGIFLSILTLIPAPMGILLKLAVGFCVFRVIKDFFT